MALGQKEGRGPEESQNPQEGHQPQMDCQVALRMNRSLQHGGAETSLRRRVACWGWSRPGRDQSLRGGWVLQRNMYLPGSWAPAVCSTNSLPARPAWLLTVSVAGDRCRYASLVNASSVSALSLIFSSGCPLKLCWLFREFRAPVSAIF